MHEERVRATRERYGPPPEIGHVWLHRPTGAAGITGIRMHLDGGPIAGDPGGPGRLLAPVTPVPLPEGLPWSTRTPQGVEEALRAHDWRVITRAEAAHRLRTAGYLLGTDREAGHLLHEDEADSTRWSLCSAEVSYQAFVTREQL